MCDCCEGDTSDGGDDEWEDLEDEDEEELSEGQEVAMATSTTVELAVVGRCVVESQLPLKVWVEGSLRPFIATPIT